MTQGKFDSTGALTYRDGDVLYDHDLNNTLIVTIPIGGIMPWCKTITGVPTLPANYLECNGTTISDAGSPLNGQTLPNLNGSTDATKIFLRGNATSGATGGVGTAHGHTFNTVGYTFIFNTGTDSIPASHNHTSPAVSSLPKYYEVVYIMRIK